jgi:hypothetical protein
VKKNYRPADAARLLLPKDENAHIIKNSMKTKELAQALLGYSSTTSLLLPGVLTAALGSEAVQDALNRGWIRPDTETGFLCLTDQQFQINELRELAAAVETEAKPEAAVESASRSFVMSHSHRLHETLGLGGDVSGTGGAPGSGQPQGQPAAAPQQTPTSPTTHRPGQDYMVGEDVMIADEGKSYQAKVQKANPDGTYVLSFGPNRPTQQNRMFRREEMQRIQAGREGTVKVQQ